MLTASVVLFAACKKQPVSSSADDFETTNSTAFTSSQYFEPPNDQKVKIKLSCSSATPLADGKLDLRDLKIEKYAVDGKLEMTLLAPQCFYQMDGTADSAGPVKMVSGDGRRWTTGTGFLFRSADDFYMISNDVESFSKTGDLKTNLP